MLGKVEFVGSEMQRDALKMGGLQWYDGEVFTSWKALKEKVDIAENKLYMRGRRLPQENLVHAFRFTPVKVGISGWWKGFKDTRKEHLNTRRSALMAIVLAVSVLSIFFLLIPASYASLITLGVLAAICFMSYLAFHTYLYVNKVPKKVAVHQNKI
jgi:hypothetical protein